jgi:hypothetical protein
MVELQFLQADRADIDAYRTQPFKIKLPYSAQIMAPRGSGGATMGTIIFTCVYIGKQSSIFFLEQAGQFQSNLIQIILG